MALDKQATNIALLDVRKICSYTDYIVILSAESERQLEAVRAEIEHFLNQEGIRVRIEGASSSGWMLLDLGDVVAHVLFPSERTYYQLDELWSDAQPLVKIP